MDKEQNFEGVRGFSLGSFAVSWEQRKLGEVGTTYTGLSGKTKEDFGHGNGQFVTYMNVFSNPVGLPDMTEAVEIDDSQNKVLFGDVLFTTSSETPEEVGMSSVWLENAENTYLNSFCFGYRPTVEFNPYYLAYMLRSSSMRKKITFLAQGISRYNISKNKMLDIEIPIQALGKISFDFEKLRGIKMESEISSRWNCSEMSSSYPYTSIVLFARFSYLSLFLYDSSITSP